MKFFSRDSNHLADYAILITSLITIIVAIRFLNFSKTAIASLTIITSLSYVAWGVMHHKKAGHIDKKIMLEYLGMAVLAIALVISLII